MEQKKRAEKLLSAVCQHRNTISDAEMMLYYFSTLSLFVFRFNPIGNGAEHFLLTEIFVVFHFSTLRIITTKHRILHWIFIFDNFGRIRGWRIKNGPASKHYRSARSSSKISGYPTHSS